MKTDQPNKPRKFSLINRSIFYYCLVSIILLKLINFEKCLTLYTARQFFFYNLYPDRLSKIVAFDNLSRLYPEPKLLAELADEYLALNQYQDAISALKRALKIDPQNKKYYSDKINLIKKHLNFETYFF